MLATIDGPNRLGETMNAGSFAPALVLNADFRPLNYFPLSLWSWQDAVKAVCLDRVTIVSEYDVSISSPTMEMKLPSVIALKEYVPQMRNPGLRICGTYSFSAITDGSFIFIVGELIETSYSDTMVTRSRHTALTASCQDQSESGK